MYKLGFGEKMNSSSLFECDVFELDANVANFKYYSKTSMDTHFQYFNVSKNFLNYTQHC